MRWFPAGASWAAGGRDRLSSRSRAQSTAWTHGVKSPPPILARGCWSQRSEVPAQFPEAAVGLSASARALVTTTNAKLKQCRWLEDRGLEQSLQTWRRLAVYRWRGPETVWARQRKKQLDPPSSDGRVARRFMYFEYKPPSSSRPQKRKLEASSCRLVVSAQTTFWDAVETHLPPRRSNVELQNLGIAQRPENAQLHPGPGWERKKLGILSCSA